MRYSNVTPASNVGRGGHGLRVTSRLGDSGASHAALLVYPRCRCGCLHGLWFAMKAGALVATAHYDISGGGRLDKLSSSSLSGQP
jgi:hypothetical protein